MGNATEVSSNPEMEQTTKKDVGNDAAPAYAPPAEDNSVLAGEDGELIDYKTLTWWYVEAEI